MDDGRNDFDFWMGSWKVRNRCRRSGSRAPTTGSSSRPRSRATARRRARKRGRVQNRPRRRLRRDVVRFFDPETKTWSIYWADSRRPGKLDPPVLGSFAGDIGRFEGEDTLAGKPILMRFDWSRVKTSSPLWEQSFSGDDGKSWETNWVMEFERVED